MRIVSLFLISLFFVSSVFAEKVIVVYKPDKSVSIITPAIKGKPTHKKYEKNYEETVKGTELEGLPYDIVDSSDLPDSNEYFQESWEGEKGEGVIPNTVKDAKIKKERKRKKLISKRKEKILEEQAIDELVEEGLIDE